MKRFLAIVGIILVCLFVVGLATYRHFVEPRHNGKSLSEWCNSKDSEAKAAIKAFGDGAAYWMLVWAEPSGDPFREMRYWWNRFSPDKLKWHPPKDPRALATKLARLAHVQVRPAIPELIQRASHADWNAIQLLKIIAPGEDALWIEILKSPDDQASRWALEHLRLSSFKAEGFSKGVTEAYRTNREPVLGSELLALRVLHGARDSSVVSEIHRYLGGDPFLEPAYSAAAAAFLMGDQGTPILMEGMLSKARMTRDACTAAVWLLTLSVDAPSERSLSGAELIVRVKGMDLELVRQEIAVRLMTNTEASVRGLGLKILEESVSARLDKGVKPAIGSREGFLKIEELSRSGDASLAKPLTELLRRVSVAEGAFNLDVLRAQ